MMRGDVKRFVMLALADIGAPVAYQTMNKPPETYVTFFIYTDKHEMYGDNEGIGHGWHIQVDVWSKSSPDNLADRVMAQMKEAGFRYVTGDELYEDDTHIYHIAQRFYLYTEG